ncbi:MAG: hypothetical protein J2O47_08890, partial [Acidimicrobiaceae bacterium]|nr:hypothetical protein [Acidimicrobiaceae bacterium]
MISIRRISLGGGYRYLIESVAAGDGAAERTNGLARYYAESGTPPGVFLGTGLADLDGGRGVEVGTLVTEGLSAADLDAIRASEAYGPLLAALRDAEARGLDVDSVFPRLAAGRSLDDAEDPAAVLHGRV